MPPDPTAPPVQPTDVGAYAPPAAASSDADAALTPAQQHALVTLARRVPWRHVAGYAATLTMALWVRIQHPGAVPPGTPLGDGSSRVQLDSLRQYLDTAATKSRSERNALKDDVRMLADAISALTTAFEQRSASEAQGICFLLTPEQRRLTRLPCDRLLGGGDWPLSPAPQLPILPDATQQVTRRALARGPVR